MQNTMAQPVQGMANIEGRLEFTTAKVGDQCYLVLGRHMDDAIGVDVKGDLNLWEAARGWRQTLQLKLAQQLVVCCHLALTLEHLDAHLRMEPTSHQCTP